MARPDPPEQRNGNGLRRLLAVALALLLWQLGAAALGQALLLPTPLAVLARLLRLAGEAGFWRVIWTSFARIVSGFLLGLAAGAALAALAGRFRWAETLLWPWVAAVKSVPVASFIILCLVWLTARRLPVFISFLMVFPIVYTNLLQGIRAADRDLLEMARVFRVPWERRLRDIWLPQLRPFLLSSCGVALGMAWKAGVTAEIIGIPAASIGERLYEAKVYFDTPGLFAWTVVVVLISVCFEKLFMRLLAALFTPRRHARPRAPAPEPPPLPPPERPPADIRIRGLWKSFGEKRVLRGFSADIPGGGAVCIMGPSGGGKTTLLRILMGLLPADGGQVSGVPARISAVFQEDRLCPELTAAENIRLAAGKRVPLSVAEAHLTALGLGDSLDAPVREFSGGMKRRAALARAVLYGGDALFLDEPFKGLDAQAKDGALGYLALHTRGRTLVLVTHDPYEAERLGARILALGQMETKGSPEASRD